MGARNSRDFPMGGTAVVRANLDILDRAVHNGLSPESIERAIHVVRVYWTNEEARSDAQRLNELHGGRVHYFTSGVHAQLPSAAKLSEVRSRQSRLEPDAD